MATMNILRGQRLKLTDIIPNNNEFQLGIVCHSPGLVIDFSCFGLDAHGKLSDDRYMTFFNQPSTPCGGVSLSVPAGDHSGFTIALQKLPVTIHRLTITAAIDGKGIMSQLTSGSLRVLVKANEVARFAFTGSDFSAERALILLEIYRKDNSWRTAALGQGFNGGLEALVKHFGGTVAESTPTVQPQSPSPVTPLNSTTPLKSMKYTIANLGTLGESTKPLSEKQVKKIEALKKAYAQGFLSNEDLAKEIEKVIH